MSVSEERKDLKRGERESKEELLIPRDISMVDQRIRAEPSMDEVWCLMERRRMTWISVTKVARV